MKKIEICVVLFIRCIFHELSDSAFIYYCDLGPCILEQILYLSVMYPKNGNYVNVDFKVGGIKRIYVNS